eukprot:jgi/Picsp_1/6612/NSC_03955-R1_protein
MRFVFHEGRLLTEKRLPCCSTVSSPSVVGRGNVHAYAKKRGKKGNSSSSDSESDEERKGAPPAPRIDPNSLIPVRKQIRYAKVYKKMMSEAKTTYRAPKAPQTYRKESKTSEQYRQERLAAQAEEAILSKQESKNFALRSLYNTALPLYPGQKKHCPVLLVDGYNVLHTWARTKDLMVSGELEEAREMLIHSLEVYSKMNGVRVVVAFDAMNALGNNGTSETLLDSGVTVVFCGDKEADSFLTAQARSWIQRGCPQVVVATSDSTLQVAIQSTKTQFPQVCFFVPASGLVSDMKATEKRAMDQVNDGSTPDLCLLECVVQSKDPNTFSALQDLRQSLLPPDPRMNNKEK